MPVAPKLLLIVIFLCFGCRSKDPPAIELVVGSAPNAHVRFVPRTSLAEYVELADGSSELRILLASYQASCERFVPPGPSDASVTVLVTVPPGGRIASSQYYWRGRDHAPPFALPSARIGPRSFVFEPGGAVQLHNVLLEPEGRVEGLLQFEFAGTGDRPQTRISGRFSAAMCRFERAREP